MSILALRPSSKLLIPSPLIVYTHISNMIHLSLHVVIAFGNLRYSYFSCEPTIISISFQINSFNGHEHILMKALMIWRSSDFFGVFNLKSGQGYESILRFHCLNLFFWIECLENCGCQIWLYITNMCNSNSNSYSNFLQDVCLANQLVFIHYWKLGQNTPALLQIFAVWNKK